MNTFNPPFFSNTKSTNNIRKKVENYTVVRCKKKYFYFVDIVQATKEVDGGALSGGDTGTRVSPQSGPTQICLKAVNKAAMRLAVYYFS